MVATVAHCGVVSLLHLKLLGRSLSDCETTVAVKTLVVSLNTCGTGHICST